VFFANFFKTNSNCQQELFVISLSKINKQYYEKITFSSFFNSRCANSSELLFELKNHPKLIELLYSKSKELIIF
jgi:hypothetical protein